MSDKNMQIGDKERARRKLVKLLTGGAGVAVGAGLVPGSWVKPVIAGVTLPPDAQLSTCCTDFCINNYNEAAGTLNYGTASLCAGILTLSGGGSSPGPWSGSGPVAADGSFNFFVATTDIGNIPVSGTVSCAGIQGIWGAYEFFGYASPGGCPVAVNCLLYGSLVVMADGSCRRVEELEVGNLVRSVVASRAGYDFTVVTRVKRNHLREAYYTINQTLRITGDHPVMARHDGSWTWVRVDRLAVGDLIKSPDGGVVVERVEKHDVPAMTVYVETNSGSFVARIGNASYVIKSTYTTAAASLEAEQLELG